MPTAELTDAELRRLERRLRSERANIDTEMRQLTGTLESVRDARSDASADDEHDPEGPTLSAEWSRIAGIHTELTQKSAAIDRALRRIKDGTYGICIRRGEPISKERLEARPAAELCIDCARELEARR
ncbi:MAG: DnaK suppressor protein [Microbacteriaceae bacterium]|jgi:DnaK suppressor protein|nr:DnaK suppressor protein [Microbacteriaceae bacterium]